MEIMQLNKKKVQISAAFPAKLPLETAHWKAALAGTHCIHCQGHPDSKLQGRRFQNTDASLSETKNKLKPTQYIFQSDIN